MATTARVILTRELAFASGADAANAQMRRAGRSAWNSEDADLAASTTNRLLVHVPFAHGGLMGLPQGTISKITA